MKQVRALVITGYGLNCDYETHFSLKLAGATPRRIHINEFITRGTDKKRTRLEKYHILVLGGGFSWADDHGAGVLMASKLRRHLGDQLEQFINDGKLVMGICNGFQALVNLGLLPAFDCNYTERRVALTHNESGNFIDTWVNLRINSRSPSVFTKGITTIELPIRHGEGKFYAAKEDMNRILENNQVVFQYADEKGERACGRRQYNPNGSLEDIAGICDPTGHILGLMPHPEAFNHYTNHPRWTRESEKLLRKKGEIESLIGDGIKIFKNGVDYIRETLL